MSKNRYQAVAVGVSAGGARCPGNPFAGAAGRLSPAVDHCPAPASAAGRFSGGAPEQILPPAGQRGRGKGSRRGRRGLPGACELPSSDRGGQNIFPLHRGESEFFAPLHRRAVRDGCGRLRSESYRDRPDGREPRRGPPVWPASRPKAVCPSSRIRKPPSIPACRWRRWKNPVRIMC